MIHSAEEFIRLRESTEQAEYSRAAKEDAPLHVWMTVIKNYPEFRVWVAHNKTVPLEILAILASDTDSKVRFMVAMKRKLPLELFESLARDPDESVRQRIACNAKTPLSILTLLSNDPEPLVSESAKEKIKCYRHA